MSDSNDARLEPAEQAFAAGDFARLRRELAALPAEARATPRAQALSRATSSDPLHLAALALCAAAIAAIALYYV